ncbi:hypothetical protein BG011_007498 [Mortierella polycephala]|uniref:Periplasmic binding protein n=1 Tax=Mortierella polycephala TaxID=41804 RepID=A0A9P6TYM2_9FUNG|nr:hypothetical protein BG011_007498 [Mortierella polycephala]
MAAQSIPIPPPNSNGKAPRWTQPVSFYGQSVFSKYYAQSICVFLLLIPFLVMPAQAQGGQGPIVGQPCRVGDYDATVDYFPEKTTVDDAALFSVRYEKNYKIVTSSAAGSSKVNTYVLTHCGTPAPDASLFANNTVFVTVPVTNAASIATTAVAFLEMLGKRSAIKAVDTEGLVSSPCVQYGLDQGEIIGFEDKNLNLRAEQFKSVDLIFSSFGAEPGTENKTVVTSEVSDPGPLNRAEWLEFYSTFFNLEAPAQKLTADINNNYNCFKKAANEQTTKPVIAWTSYVAPSSYNNNTASWTISGAPYKEIISTDAGAQFYNGTDSNTFTIAADFANALKDVDVIIDETMSGEDIESFYKNYELTASSPHKFIQNKAIFRQDGIVNPNDGRDWFAGAVVMNDAVLQDIVRTVHPEVLPADVPYNWIRNIAKGEVKKVLTSADCKTTDSSTPIPDRALVCATMKAGGNAGSKTVAGALTAVLGLVAIALTL